MIAAIIPARYASTRFPGKPLVDILGKPMIQRVYEQVSQCTTVKKTVVATDDQRIFDKVRSFGGEVVMTGTDHPSGTDRCWDAFSQLKGEFRYIINVQGDEPFIEPEQVDELGRVLLNEDVELATQMIAVDNHEVLFDRGEVKIVLNRNSEALYFSRMVIPLIKGVDEKDWHNHHTYYRHVGMYAYRADILKRLTQLPVSSLEKAESLEQLRWIENGFKIRCVLTRFDSHCIDTPGDVEKVLKIKGLK